MSEHAPYCPLPVVLIVENDVLERMFKAATLRRQGLEVFEAADIAEAVTVLTPYLGSARASAKPQPSNTYLNRRYRRAEAYNALDGFLSMAIQQQERVDGPLADFLAAPPQLAKHLARWQAEDAKA
jgi:hypothetical protein